MAATTKAQEMIAWAQTWAEFFAPAVADDNDWYRDGRPIDGKDAGDLGEGLAEVARLLTVAQERIAALAVLDRLWQTYPTCVVHLQRGSSTGLLMAFAYPKLGGADCIYGEGDSPTAALLALGARLEGQNCPESDERFSHE